MLLDWNELIEPMFSSFAKFNCDAMSAYKLSTHRIFQPTKTNFIINAMIIYEVVIIWNRPAITNVWQLHYFNCSSGQTEKSALARQFLPKWTFFKKNFVGNSIANRSVSHFNLWHDLVERYAKNSVAQLGINRVYQLHPVHLYVTEWPVKTCFINNLSIMQIINVRIGAFTTHICLYGNWAIGKSQFIRFINFSHQQSKFKQQVSYLHKNANSKMLNKTVTVRW